MTDSNQQIVAPDTDDLDAFTDLFNGKAREPEPVVDEDSEPEAPEPEVEVETDEPEDDTLAPDETDDEVDEPKEDADPDPEPEPKPESRSQKRIKELVAKNREQERAYAELARKVAELEQAGKPKEPVAPAAVDPKAPTADDLNPDGTEKYPLGEFDPLYIRDLSDYSMERKYNELKEKDAQERAAAEAAEAQARLVHDWSEKLAKAEDKYPDMLEKNEILEDTFVDLDPAYGEYLASTIMSMDYGVDVLYYLANNVDEAKRIASSGPTKATIALGRLEAKFADDAAEKQLKKPKVSQAPTPPPSVNKGSAARTAIPADTDDLDAFEKVFYAKK